MNLREFLLDTHRILDNVQIPHALIGGFAMAALGFPRATSDVDYLVHGGFRRRTTAVFEQAGFEVFHGSEEVLQLTREYALDILFANRPPSRGMLLRAMQGHGFLGIPHLEAEDIIGLKIQAYKNDPRRKLGELADICELARISPRLDHERILHYANLFDERERIEVLLRDTPPPPHDG